MNTPKDTDLHEALRRKYANTPQMKLSLTPRPLQGERELKRKVFPLSWRGIGGGLIAASILLFLVFRFGMEKTEQQPVVAEVIEPEIVEQPAPENSEISESPEISESSESSEYSEYSENSESSEPQKPVKPKRTRKVQVPKEEPLLAEAEPMPEETEAEPVKEEAEYRNIQTIQVAPDQVVYIVQASDVSSIAAMPSVGELRARGQQLVANVQQQINESKIQF